MGLDRLEQVGFPQGRVDEDIDAKVQAAVDALIAGAPGALDTLNELAAALGEDPNFATTVTNALAAKQPLDADLTAIAALTTTPFGRSVLETGNAAALRTLAGLVIGTNVAAQSGAWAAYTPTWTAAGTAPALGDGTLTGAFVQMGKTVFFRARLVAGASTTYGTSLYRLGLPVPAITGADHPMGGSAYIANAGTAAYLGFLQTVAGGASLTIPLHSATVEGGLAGYWGATVPFTFGVGDSVLVAGSYEAA